MTYTFKLARRIARLRAPMLAGLLVALAACDSDKSFSPELSESAPVASAAFAGGIPFGFFAQPTTEFGARYNGGHQNISPNRLIAELAQIKARGGKVVLALSGSPKYYVEGGRFSMSKWKARIDAYKGINFTPYINDGTVLGHYMIDEPNDPANWNGQPVPPATLEEMAKYSKSIWPDMPTIVRVEPVIWPRITSTSTPPGRSTSTAAARCRTTSSATSPTRRRATCPSSSGSTCSRAACPTSRR